jgi:serine/threonine-protein kinase HipA
MKFSVLRDPEKIALPAHDQRGDWIVKLDSARFPNVVENEFAVMEWARSSGFDVPECHLQEVRTLSEVMRVHGLPGTKVFVIRRYDRERNRKVHQEDLAQVAGLSPLRKYDHLRYEQCAYLVGQIVGRSGYTEFIRRLAFVIASGNADAHLKNWSLVYPDGIQATLAPLYDQVSTIAWPDVPSELALKLAGTKNWFQIDLERFGRLAELAREDPKSTMSVVTEALEKIVMGWNVSSARDIMPRKHIEALRDFWRRVPLLRPHADALA